MLNTVFTCGEPFQFNACVGNNGFIDYLTYADGYSKASDLLLEYVLINDGRDVDLYIYPICFNMRHSIELRLKGAIHSIKELADVKNKTIAEFDLAKSHDILNIWQYYKNTSQNLDSRFNRINTLLNQTILDIGKVDSTGQVFRYPIDENNDKHLVDESSINCLTLKIKFEELEKYLNVLDSLNKYLVEEYELKIFTSKLSRAQIYNMAKELPKKKDWSTALNKIELREKYDISSNELSKAINFIKENYEMSGFIGETLPLLTLDDSFLIELCDIWSTNISPDFRGFYNGEISSITLGGDNSEELSLQLEEIKRINVLKNIAFSNLENRLTIEEVADLWALFYLSRDKFKYSEWYSRLFKDFKKEILKENNLMKSFGHIFNKSSFLEQIIRSLYFLQQNVLADTIVDRLDLKTSFKFIDEAKDRSLFNKWHYLELS